MNARLNGAGDRFVFTEGCVQEILLDFPREVIADGALFGRHARPCRRFRTSRLLRWNLVAPVASQDEDQVWLAIPYIYYFENVSGCCSLRHVARAEARMTRNACVIQVVIEAVKRLRLTCLAVPSLVRAR